MQKLHVKARMPQNCYRQDLRIIFKTENIWVIFKVTPPVVLLNDKQTYIFLFHFAVKSLTVEGFMVSSVALLQSVG